MYSHKKHLESITTTHKNTPFLLQSNHCKKNDFI